MVVTMTGHKVEILRKIDLPPSSLQDNLYTIHLRHAILPLHPLLFILSGPYILNIPHNPVPTREKLRGIHAMESVSYELPLRFIDNLTTCREQWPDVRGCERRYNIDSRDVRQAILDMLDADGVGSADAKPGSVEVDKGCVAVGFGCQANVRVSV